jgi:hypothetical protein
MEAVRQRGPAAAARRHTASQRLRAIPQAPVQQAQRVGGARQGQARRARQPLPAP